MGLIRKTLSVSTLGVIPFRSRKERLRRAEASVEDAAQALERERQAREAADRRVAEAEQRAKAAELEAVHAARKAERRRRRRRRMGAMEQATAMGHRARRRARGKVKGRMKEMEGLAKAVEGKVREHAPTG